MVGLSLPYPVHSLANISLGAPDCYRFDEFMQRSTIEVKQTVDVWSLGCIFSEVAVWVVHDKDRLEAYREARHDETKQLFDFRDGRAFHDSENVLLSVHNMHEELLENVRRSDHVTKSVVKRMIAEMLGDVDGRPNTKQLLIRARNISEEARMKLNTAKGEQLGPDVQSQKRVPPVVPPGFLQTQSDRTGLHSGPGRWPSLSGREKRRSATLNVLARPDTPSPELPADAEYDSPGEMSNTTLTPPTSSPAPNAGNRSQHRRQFTNDSATNPNSPGRRKFDDLSQDHSPTPQRNARERDSTRRNNRRSDQLRDQSLSGQISGLNITDVEQNFSDRPQAEDQPSLPSDLNALQSEFLQNTTSNKTASPPATNTRTTKDLPYTSIVDAENWILNKKHPGGTYQPLKHRELLDALKERDHVSRFNFPQTPVL